jgi:hypothetical protein
MDGKFNFELSGFDDEFEKFREEANEATQNQILNFNKFIHGNMVSAVSKERSELTENEEFALAYSAGVRLIYPMGEDGKFKTQTEPVGILKDGDKWVVLTKGDGWILNVSN